MWSSSGGELEPPPATEARERGEEELESSTGAEAGGSGGEELELSTGAEEMEPSTGGEAGGSGGEELEPTTGAEGMVHREHELEQLYPQAENEIGGISKEVLTTTKTKCKVGRWGRVELEQVQGVADGAEGTGRSGEELGPSTTT